MCVKDNETMENVNDGAVNQSSRSRWAQRLLFVPSSHIRPTLACCLSDVCFQRYPKTFFSQLSGDVR